MSFKLLSLSTLILCVFSSSFLDHHTPAYTVDMVDYINSIQDQWTAGHNSLFQRSDIYSAKALMGVLPTPPSKRLPKKLFSQSPVSLPSSFDSRTAWPLCTSIREVRDQSTCGSCWVFGAVTAMSDRICIASNQTRQDRLSSEDLLSCCGSSCGDGCNGGYPAGAWQYWVDNGIVTGDLFGDNNWCLFLSSF